MQEDNHRLIDEALASEPIKNTFRLGWEFIILNKTFTLTAMAIFIALNLFASLPVLALFFIVFAAVFGISIQVHAGRTFYGAQDIEVYVNEVEGSSVGDVLGKHLRTATGVYLGWLSLSILLLVAFVFMGSISGVFHEKMTEQDALVALQGLSLPLLIIALGFLYVNPLVHSNIVLANSLKEGFKAVYSVFSKDVWSSAMNGEYFWYIVKAWGVLLIVLLSAALTVGFLAMVPVLGVIASILMLPLMYIFMVFMSVLSMMARRIVEE